MTRGSNTNNVAEAGIRVLKEIVFGRVKAYNLIQMFHFITTTMEIYYSNRLLDIAHSRYRPGMPFSCNSCCLCFKTTLMLIKQGPPPV